jgi:hypothetical protein
LPRIGPPAVEDVVVEIAFFDIGVVDVGDFKLAARRGFEAFTKVEDAPVIHVDAGNRVAACGFRRFFFDAYDSIAVELRAAEAFRVFDFLQ